MIGIKKQERGIFSIIPLIGEFLVGIKLGDGREGREDDSVYKDGGRVFILRIWISQIRDKGENN